MVNERAIWIGRDTKIYRRRGFRRFGGRSDHIGLGAPGKPVSAIYIHETDAGLRRPGGASRWWLEKSLDELALSLGDIGVPLNLGEGQPVRRTAFDGRDDWLRERFFRHNGNADVITVDHRRVGVSALRGQRRPPVLPTCIAPLRGGSVLITSKRSVGEWGNVFGDAVVATAILDRLLNHSTVITTRGDSYRVREKRRSGLLQKTGPAHETNENENQ